MPTLHVELFAGRSAEQKRQLVAALTEATVRVLDCAPDAVDIVLSEVSREHWATGGVLWSERQG
ncbi:4-oxalocrotonate tautomerase [uncultured Dechloromonas sp.]|uniref:4-oxalocrotonate tautomerase n=1 Tax=uncultured Dechloromonas sp. TaxID=171719 RepID=UPI0025D94424|nr:4-oxalocrotonate tautomerase [uncultured Dechloromonas sp.]